MSQSKKGWLNRSILDQGWGLFRQLLKYKLEEKGGFLYLVDPAYTSQTCSQCQHVDAASRISQAEFKCTNCNYEANADDNAAENILALWVAGQAVQNCGGSGVQEVMGPLKQESTTGQDAVLKESACASVGSDQVESAFL